MIERLCGICVHKSTGSAVIDVQGVGYGVEMAEPDLARMAEGEPATLWVHTHVREDALRLFGFPTLLDRQMFLMLIGVSGVGPKLAMAVMSHVPVGELLEVVETERAEVLKAVPGIGPQQSKKLILELKPKVAKLRAGGTLVPASVGGSRSPDRELGNAGARLSPELQRDLRSALENFGYKEREFAPLLRQWEQAAPAQDLPVLMRLALTELSRAPAANGAGRIGAEEDLF